MKNDKHARESTAKIIRAILKNFLKLGKFLQLDKPTIQQSALWD